MKMVTTKGRKTTHNTTGIELEQILRMPLLGTYRNEWRMRTVSLYRESPGYVISIGESFDDSMVVVARETDLDHCRALDAFAHGNFRYVAR
jgi:hypothetical protein